MPDNSPDFRAELAKSLKELVTAHAGKIADLRARELNKSAGRKLSKSDLCPLCGNVDDILSCTCLRKAEGGSCSDCGKPMTGHLAADNTRCGFCKTKPPKSIKKDDMSGNVGGPDQGPMAMSEMCKSCGKSGDLCKCGLCKEELGKNDDKMATLFGKEPKKKDVLPKGPGPKSYGRPEGCKHGLNSSCEKCGSAGAYKKDELPLVRPAPEAPVEGAKLPGDKKSKHGGMSDEGSGGAITKKSALTKAALPGMAPKPMAPVAPIVGVPGKQPVGQGGGDKFKLPAMQKQTPVAQVNQEMGGFKSIAKNPVALPGTGAKLVNAPKPGMPVAGNNPKPVAGVVGKGEMSTGYGAKVGITMDQRPKAAQDKDFTSNRPPVKKDELSTAVHAEADKKAGGVGWLNKIRTGMAKQPKAPKPNDIMAVRDKMNLKAAKMEGPAPTEGFNSANHNRRMR